ncbi:hypothetical protein crov337 [Cafeteria roenbergensis virus]|uniref:Uncharacterized protein n=1 Tax=Cafeteria roenbergensis virus (strain BV-PW1) TaxID=693272 RepID=E3T5A8_CROVB|nr:hypothetical protein crov337 [Cafeteria roenbergensis virus BV-PW1]ADO67371.1 hypothetical protein crov337 [Cafeteria roenbergensis virus BV-PW1]
MDDSLVIYSSVFVLVLFIILYKLLQQKIYIALGIPIILLIIYFLLIIPNSSHIEESMDILTDMPIF